MKVLLFNPENDMALADGHSGYTPPKHIRQMRRDLWDLPALWAKEGDFVWDGETPLHLREGDEILPWGWSPALCHQLRLKGVEENFLPTAEELERRRSLSHRRTAVEALSLLRGESVLGGRTCGHSTLCTSMEEVLEAASQWPQALLKAPWSSSGKGLQAWGMPEAERWAAHILQQQGSVIAEEWLHKRFDFAMEFWKEGKGDAAFRGLSLFSTNEKGAYTGNLLATEEEKRERIAQWVKPSILEGLAQWWEGYLADFEYKGPVGVDMMVCTDGSICPCIETNWRHTMGMVAILLAEKGLRGRFSICHENGRFQAKIDSESPDTTVF